MPERISGTTHPHGSALLDRLERMRHRLGPDLELPQVALDLLAAALEDAGATRGSIMLVNPDTGRLRIIAGVGLPPEAIGQDLKPAVRRISDWVLRESQPLVLNGEVRDHRFEGSDPRAEIDSALSLPLAGSRGPLGVLNLARVSAGSVFTPVDLERIRAEMAPLGELFERLQELHVALRSWRKLRTALRPWPVEVHSSRRYQMAVSVARSSALAGDLCDRVLHGSGAQTVLLGDVAGRGALAIAAAALARGLFLAHARYSRSPAEIVRLMNLDLCEKCDGRSHLAVWVAHLTPTGGVVSCNAGFPEPLWIPIDGGAPRWLPVGGPLAGVDPGATYEQEHTQLLPGDVVLAVTDGVLRAGNPAGEELGLERLEERAGELRRRPLDQLVSGVLDLAREFSGAGDPVDDQAALALRFSRED
jgi:stage II sporulation SpoE-like protein/GAF domain-containing protein